MDSCGLKSLRFSKNASPLITTPMLLSIVSPIHNKPFKRISYYSAINLKDFTKDIFAAYPFFAKR